MTMPANNQITRIGARFISSCFVLVLLAGFKVVPQTSYAQQVPLWCEEDPEKGWHFYCDDDEEPAPLVVEEDIEEPTPPPPPVTLSAVEQVAMIGRALDESKATAILDPTPENVEAYLVLQGKTFAQSARFADVWRRVVWQNPELDYEGEHPQSHKGKIAAREAIEQQQKDTVERLTKTHALIYIASGYCPVCTTYGPDLRLYAEKYGMTTLAVSIDGTALPGWESANFDTEKLAALGVDLSRIPLTLLFHQKLNEVTVVGVGYLAEQEITRRIHTLVALEVGDAF